MIDLLSWTVRCVVVVCCVVCCDRKVAKLWLQNYVIIGLKTSGWGRRNIVAIFAEEFGDGQGTARQLHDKFLHDIRIPPFFFYFSSLLLSVAATAPTRDFSEKNVFAISIK